MMNLISPIQIHPDDQRITFIKDTKSLAATLCYSVYDPEELYTPTISMNDGGTTQLTIMGQAGDLVIEDCDTAGDHGILEFTSGQVYLQESCTAGYLSVRGLVKLHDNTLDDGTIIERAGMGRLEYITPSQYTPVPILDPIDIPLNTSTPTYSEEDNRPLDPGENIIPRAVQ